MIRVSHSEERSRPAGNLDDLDYVVVDDPEQVVADDLEQVVVDDLEQVVADVLPAEEHVGPLEQPIHVQQS